MKHSLGTSLPRLRMFLLAISTGLWPSLASGATVHPQNDDNRSPFPNDRFTVTDVSHNTRLRVNLPKPDCTVRRSDCEDVDVINTLDGFSLQPRLSIPFDGPIDVGTVTSDTVFVLKLGSTLVPPIHWQRRIIGINRVLWDPATLTLFAEPDEVLEQHTRYVLVVTRDVRDGDGNPVAAAPGFERVRVAGKKVAVTSVFTTQSVTAVLEKIRDQIKATVPDRADFLLGPGRSRTVFALDQIQGITISRQTTVNPPQFGAPSPAPDLAPLNIIPGAVGQLAFGKYLSPDYLTHPGEFIPPVGTRTGTPQVRGVNEIHFNLYLPAGRQPTAGWPAAIVSHGANASKDVGQNMAATLAVQGIATISINHPGHGGGPLSTYTVRTKNGASIIFSAGGRAFDQNGDGVIGLREGDSATAPRTIMAVGDGVRQTVADVIQLVRVIEMGLDVDGDGRSDLAPRRIYSVGNSLGGGAALVLTAIDPNVRATVMVSPASANPEAFRLSPVNRTPNIGNRLASRVPSLINTPGITSIGGIPVPQPHFNENRPLKNQPAVINTVQGATAIQTVLDRMEWVRQFGTVNAYVRHLRKEPLQGVPPKSVLFHLAKGDQTVPNVDTSQMLLTGDLVDRAMFYRHDVAFAENPSLPKNAHVETFGFSGGVAFAPGFALNSPAVAIALAAQEQVARFLESDGALIIQPLPVRYFESPIRPPLPDGLYYIP